MLKHIPGDKLNIGESSSASRSRMLSSSVGSVSLTRSLENPDAMSSSCWTGCLGRRGKKNLLSFPLVVLLPAWFPVCDTTIVVVVVPLCEETRVGAEPGRKVEVDWPDEGWFCMFKSSSSWGGTGVSSWVWPGWYFLMCFDRSPLYRNLFKQVFKRHLNGFSPRMKKQNKEIYKYLFLF